MKMLSKSLLFGCLLAAYPEMAESQDFRENQFLDDLEILLGDTRHVLASGVRVAPYIVESFSQYSCSQTLSSTAAFEFLVPALPGSFDPRQGSPQTYAFPPLGEIDGRWAAWPRQIGPTAGERTIGIFSYKWFLSHPDLPIVYGPNYDRSGGTSSILIGFRITHTDGRHHGWLRMTRDAITVTNLFAFDSYAIHPVPDEPIQAGVEPPPPILEADVGGAGSETGLVLRWAPGYSDNAGYRLESTGDLTPPVEWQWVESYSGEHRPPEGAEHRFYRLRKP